MVMTYDRRAPAGLMDALTSGFASSLSEYVLAGQYPVDLQLRGYEGKSTHRATLYVGLTKVLDLHHNAKGRFKLTAHGTWAATKHGWGPQWATFQAASRFLAEWSAVEDYLDNVIPAVGASFLKEGRTQAAVSTLRNRSLVPIDREVVIAFSDATERKATLSALAEPLLAAVAESNGAAWWETRPKSLGGECDALALRDGELLAIEIKPKSASAQAITWVPLQVRHYANIVAEWARTHEFAAEIVNGMVQQRAELGLIDGDIHPVRRPLTVRPVVVLQHGCSTTALKRMWEVEERLLAAGFDDPPLEVFALTPAGRLKRLSASQLV